MTSATHGPSFDESGLLEMVSTRRQHEADGPGWLHLTQRYTRSSVGLRGAPAAEIRLQPSVNPRSSVGKDMSATTSKSRSGKDHTSSRWLIYDFALPRRSSLRRALRESLKLSYATSPAITSALLDPAPVELQVPSREPRDQTPGDQRGIRTGSADNRSSALPHLPPLKAIPQRSSLRRAIRESQKEIDAVYENSILPPYHPKLDPAQSAIPSLESVKKGNAKTQNQVGSRKNAQRDALLSSHSKGEAVSPTIPQRSSLRLAIRESLSTNRQTNAYVDMRSAGVSSGRGTILKDTIETSLPTSDNQSDGVISLSDSSAALPGASFTQDVGYILETPSRLSRTSSIATVATSPGPTTPVPPSLLAALRLQKGFISESYLVTESPTSQSLFSPPKSSSFFCSSPELRDESGSPITITRHQLPSMVSRGWGTPDSGKLPRDPTDTKSESVRRGWHQVREIANEAPNGLYLVEWEGLDPRTGVKWPASWVMAKDVSESAIRHWEERKHQILLGSKGKL